MSDPCFHYNPSYLCLAPLSDLSFWYQYRELATRGAIFYSMSTLAGAFNGLIAYGIDKDMDGLRGWRAWRWIFLIEGVMPCVAAIFVLFLLPASPEKLRFGFTPEEKALAVRRSRRAHNTSEARLEIKKIPLVLMSLHFWLLLGIACCGHFCVGSMSNFLPAIIQVIQPYSLFDLGVRVANPIYRALDILQ